MIKNKIIWTYWHQGFDKAPHLIKKCIEQWYKLHKDWTINLLDEDSVHTYIDPIPLPKDTLEKLSLAHRSDLIRTQLLIKYGGVWADPTCFPNKPLDDWLFHNLDAGIFLFYKPGRDRIISNWFIAAEQEHELLIELLQKLISYWQENDFINFDKSTIWYEPMVKRIFNRNLLTTRLWFNWFTRKVLRLCPYMIYHYTFYRVLQLNNKNKRYWKIMPKLSADGPHKLQRIGLLSKADNHVKELIDKKETPLFKLTYKLKEKSWSSDSVLGYLFNH